VGPVGRLWRIVVWTWLKVPFRNWKVALDDDSVVFTSRIMKIRLVRSARFVVGT
jgi:hypothetical protein